MLFQEVYQSQKNIEGNSWKGIVRGKFYLVMENLWEYLQIKKIV